jgi:hypothetical protein
VLRLRSSIMGCLAGVEASVQAAVELQVSFVLLLRVYSAHRCAVGPHVAATSERCVRECVDAFRSINGDAKLTSRFRTQKFHIKSNEIF